LGLSPGSAAEVYHSDPVRVQEGRRLTQRELTMTRIPSLISRACESLTKSFLKHSTSARRAESPGAKSAHRTYFLTSHGVREHVARKTTGAGSGSVTRSNGHCAARHEGCHSRDCLDGSRPSRQGCGGSSWFALDSPCCEVPDGGGLQRCGGGLVEVHLRHLGECGTNCRRSARRAAARCVVGRNARMSLRRD
jgi:hypothetical protein